MKKYEVYVGCEYDKDGKEFLPPLESADDLAVKYFGGFSRHFVEGAYRHADGHLAREQSVCYVLFCDPQQTYSPMGFAKHCKTLFNQESVCLVSPDGSVEFI